MRSSESRSEAVRPSFGVTGGGRGVRWAWGRAGYAAVLAAACGVAATPRPTAAQTVVDLWWYGPTNANWFNTPSNWGTSAASGAIAGTLPAANTRARFFSGSSNRAVSINGAGAITRGVLVESSVAGPVSFSGSSLQIGDLGFTNTSSSNVTISNNLTTYTNAAAGNVGNAFNFAVNSSGNINLSGTALGTGIALNKHGFGTLIVTAAQAYTGPTVITAGAINFFGSGATHATSSIAVSSGATVRYDVSAGTYDGGANPVVFTGTGTFSKTGAGTLTWGVQSANFQFGAGSLIDVQGGTFTGGSNNNEVWTNNLSALNVAAVATFRTVEANVRVDALTGAGTVQTGLSPSLPGSLTVGVNNTAATIYNAAGTATFSGVIANTVGATTGGRLFKVGSGTQILTGANTYTGPTSVTGGVLQLGNGGTTGSLASPSVSIDLGATLAFNRSDDLTFASAISGAGSVAKLGAGTLTVTGGLAHTGPTTIAAGTLSIGNGGTTGSLAGDAVNNSSLVFNRSDDIAYAGVISGAGALTKLGAGALTLSAASSYSGPTTLAGGMLVAGSPGALGSGTIAFAGGVLGYGAGNSADYSSRIAPGASAIAVDTGGQTVTFASSIPAAHTGGLNKIGAGTLVLTAANAYAGPTLVSGGTLQLGNGSTGGSVPGDINNDATLTFNRSDSFTFGNAVSGTGSVTKLGAGTITVTGSLAHSGPTTISAGSLQVGNGGTSGTISGSTAVTLGTGSGLIVNRSDDLTLPNALSGPGSFTKSGAGTLTLTGATYAGPTRISAGTLRIGNGNAVTSFPTSAITLEGSSFAAGTSLEFNTSGTLTVAAPIAPSSVIGVRSTIAQLGPGTVVLTGSPSFPGAVQVAGGTLRLQGGPNASNPATIAINMFSMSGGLVTADALAFSDVNAQPPTLPDSTMSAGVLTVNRLSVGRGGFSPGQPIKFFQSGGTLTTASLNVSVYSRYVLSGGTATAGSVSLSSDTALPVGSPPGTSELTLSGGVLIVTNSFTAAPTTVVTFDGGTVSFPASVVLGVARVNAGGAVLDTGAGNVTISAPLLSNSATGGLTKLGGNTLTLTAANTYRGTTTFAGGTLVAANPNALGTGGALRFAGGTLRYGAGNTSDYSSRFVTTPAGQIRIDTNGQTVSFSSAIPTGSGLTKLGAGLLRLNASSNTTADIVIAEGTLDEGVTQALGRATITFTGGVLRSATFTSPPVAYGSRIRNSTAAIAIDTNGQNAFLAGSLDATNTGGLTKLGAGSLSLGAANAYSGPTTIVAGDLVISNAGALSSGSVTFAGGNLIYQSGAPDISARIRSSTGPISVGGNGFTAWASPIDASNIGGLTVLPNFWLALNASNSYGGTTTLRSSARIDAGVAGALSSGTITFSGGTLTHTGSNTEDYSARIRSSTGPVAIWVDTSSPVIYASPIDVTNTGGLAQIGNGTLVLTASNTYGGTTTVSFGRLQLGNGGTSGSVPGPIVNNATLEVRRSDDLTLPGRLTGTGFLGKFGAGTLSFAGQTQPLMQGSISIPFGAIDLTTNALILRSADLALVRADVAAGRLLATPAAFMSLAVFPNADGSGAAYYPSYGDLALLPNDLIVRRTYTGDTNIDGVLDGFDLANFIEGFSTGATGWQNGDFNYDGAVNAADYALLSAGLAANLPPLGSPLDLSPGGGAIPEPAAGSLLLVASLGLRRRRRA